MGTVRFYCVFVVLFSVFFFAHKFKAYNDKIEEKRIQAYTPNAEIVRMIREYVEENG